MSRTPEVSVVMSAYNGAGELAETMDSVLSQQGVDFEFIIVDDGSTDATADMLADYARRDSRVNIIRQDNKGLTEALVRGCAAVQGEFIARQDVGDLSLPGRLKRQVELLRVRPDCVLVSCWTDTIGPNGEFLHTAKGTGAAAQPVDILDPNAKWGVVDGPTSHPSVMFRTAQYKESGGYRPPFYFGQDWDLWYRLAALGKFCVLQESLCACRVTLGSISAARKPEQETFARFSHTAMQLRRQGLSDDPVLAEVRKFRQSLQRRPANRRHKAAAHYFIGKCLLDNRDKAAFGYLRAAVKEDPLRIQAWVSLARSLTLLGSRSPS